MSSAANTPLPHVVSQNEWNAAREAFRTKEKELTRARDALAAERRRLPMVRLQKSYTFDAPIDGNVENVTLLDLFEQRRQLLLYHFMFAPTVDGWPSAGCPGCSMFLDGLGQFTTTHLNARDVSFAVVSRAPIARIEAYRTRMGWPVRWVSSSTNTFNVDLGLTTDDEEKHGISVFLRDGDSLYRTYFTSARGVEGLGSVWSLLDITPFGRQEVWEDSPKGWPQGAPYEWWRRHDEYEATSR